jgi:hypothetical protein
MFIFYFCLNYLMDLPSPTSFGRLVGGAGFELKAAVLIITIIQCS